jgi:predicted nucleotide-binding protein
VEKALNKINILLQEGEFFSYANFATKGEYGYPSSLSPDWLAWIARVKALLHRLLGSNSPPLDMLKAGDEINLIGWGDDKFQQAKAYYSGALKAAEYILQDDTFTELQGKGSVAPATYSNQVFIVHGHDDHAKAELEVFLSEIGLEPVVLHRQPDRGRTVIEKFEEYSDVGYVFVLLTPDEISYLAKQETVPDVKRVKERRARPNVIFEFGYFVGKLSRSRVCCLYTGDVTLPSDVHGLLYKRYEKQIEEVAYPIIRELRAAGYELRFRGGKD